MKSIRVTRRAQAQLADIFLYSIEHWGDSIAERYRDSLIARLHALAAGEPPAGRSCGLLISPGRSDIGLKYFREGGHFIVYRETADTLIVLDFIHQSRKLDDIIDRLTNSDDQ
ncbi:MAG: type II toxin-antitoxin system RelE/ParE family toxin [Alphaproteobacteria bacterium]